MASAALPLSMVAVPVSNLELILILFIDKCEIYIDFSWTIISLNGFLLAYCITLKIENCVKECKRVEIITKLLIIFL